MPDDVIDADFEIRFFPLRGKATLSDNDIIDEAIKTYFYIPWPKPNEVSIIEEEND